MCMRTAGSSRFAAMRLFSAAFVFAFAAALMATGGAARADDKPFWEQSEAAKPAKSGYKKVSYKKSAYKNSSYAKSVSTMASKSSGSKKYAAKSLSKSNASASTKKLGGYAEASEPKKKKKGYKVAALGGAAYGGYESSKKSLSGGKVNWTASASCLDSSLKAVIYAVAANYGPLRVNSTCRSRGHNRSVGGARKSKHLSGDAVDFRVFGNVRGVYAYLRDSGSVGGLKHYGGGLFHIDNGPRRSW